MCKIQIFSSVNLHSSSSSIVYIFFFFVSLSQNTKELNEAVTVNEHSIKKAVTERVITNNIEIRFFLGPLWTEKVKLYIDFKSNHINDHDVIISKLDSVHSVIFNQ